MPDGLTTSANSSNNAFNQSEKLLETAAGGCAAATILLSGPAMKQLSGPALKQLSGPALAAPALAAPAVAGPAMSGGRRRCTTAAGGRGLGITVAEVDDTRRFAAGSTNRRWCRKKSTPRIGNRTSAKRRGHLYRLLSKERMNSFSPQQEMADPDGPARRGPDGGEDEWCGKILKLAPVSTRKRLLDIWSKI